MLLKLQVFMASQLNRSGSMGENTRSHLCAIWAFYSVLVAMGAYLPRTDIAAASLALLLSYVPIKFG